MKSLIKLSFFILFVVLSKSCLKKSIDFKREGYNGSYSEKYGQSLYIHYYLTQACHCGKQKRTNNFKDDSLTKIPLLHYYKSSGFDRGHLKPADHSRCSKENMKSSFNALNISPQTPNLNRGIWKKLESFNKNLLSKNDSIEVYSGPIFRGKKKYLEGKTVRIPSAFFKSIKLNDSLFISFIVPHYENQKNTQTEDNPNIKELLVSVNEIEKIIKIDLFPGTAEYLEKKIDTSLVNNIIQFNCNN